MSPTVDLNQVRIAVQAYARNLCVVLDHNLGVLTDYGGMDRSVYQAANLQQHDERRFTDWNFGQERIYPSPQIETKLFDEWQEARFKEPLLIVAPAGSGKSCLLESFALRMAIECLENKSWEDENRFPSVPLFIPLIQSIDLSLEEYLRKAETNFTQRPPSLNNEVLQFLRDHRQLVLLIDGFDEVPELQERLYGEIPRLGCCFAVTSRPGNGERRLVSDDRQRTIEELTLSTAQKYARQYFTLKSSRDDVAFLLSKAWSSPMQQLLGRPLYLKAWCDCLHDNFRAPDSLDELGFQLLIATFRSRSIFPIQLGVLKLRLEIIKFLEWFGSVGLALIENGFRAKTDRVLHIKGVQPDRSDIESLDSFFTIACKCGLLIHKKTDDTCYLPKTPLVEYAIGKAAAVDALTNPTRPEFLLNLFCRLVHQPKLFEILDYAFDALFQDETALKSRAWGFSIFEALLEADFAMDLKDNSHEEVLRNLQGSFTLAVLRWFPKHVYDEECDTTTIGLLRKVLSGEYRWADLMSTPHDGFPAFILLPLVKKLMLQYYANDPNPIQPVYLIRCGWEVRRFEAFAAIQTWIEEYHNANSNKEKSSWLQLISNANYRIDQHDNVTLLVKMYLQAFRESSDSLKMEWLELIGREYEKFDSILARELVQELIDCFTPMVSEANDLPPDHDDYFFGWNEASKLWSHVIKVAIQHCSKDSLDHFINRAIHEVLQDFDGEQVYAWFQVLIGCAEEIEIAGAMNLIERLTQHFLQHKRILEHERLDFHWCYDRLICALVKQLSESEASNAIEDFITYFYQANHNLEHRLWSNALDKTFDRIGEQKWNEVRPILDSFCSELDRSKQINYGSEVIYEIARRTHSSQTLQQFEYCTWRRKQARSSNEKYIWGVASRIALRRLNASDLAELCNNSIKVFLGIRAEPTNTYPVVPIDQALDHAKEWDLHAIAKVLFAHFAELNDSDDTFVCLRAIKIIASRVSPTDEFTFINRLIDLYCCSTFPDAFKRATEQKNEIRRNGLCRSSFVETPVYKHLDSEDLAQLLLGTEIVEASAKVSKKYIESVCNQLIALGLADRALEIAKSRKDVAVIHCLLKRDNGSPLLDKLGNQKVHFKAVLRETMIFDSSLIKSPKFNDEAPAIPASLPINEHDSSVNCNLNTQLFANLPLAVELKPTEIAKAYGISIGNLMKPIESLGGATDANTKLLRLFYEIGVEYGKSDSLDSVIAALKTRRDRYHSYSGALLNGKSSEDEHSPLQDWPLPDLHLPGESVFRRSCREMDEFFAWHFYYPNQKHSSFTIWKRVGVRVSSLSKIGLLAWCQTRKYLISKRLLQKKN